MRCAPQSSEQLRVCQTTVRLLLQSGAALRVTIELLHRCSVANPSYLREYKALGTAGGLYHFRDAILRAPVPDHIFICNIDICSTFPFEKLLDVHTKHRGVGTIMGVPVSLLRAA